MRIACGPIVRPDWLHPSFAHDRSRVCIEGAEGRKWDIEQRADISTVGAKHPFYNPLFEPVTNLDCYLETSYGYGGCPYSWLLHYACACRTLHEGLGLPLGCIRFFVNPGRQPCL